MLDDKVIKKDFPIFAKERLSNFAYLDNAATSQKPQVVIDALEDYYTQFSANIHRGIHTLADESTRVFHESRKKIANFFGAEDEELIIVRNTTEAINGFVYGIDQKVSQASVLLSTLQEHHSNFVPIQQLSMRKKAQFAAVAVDQSGQIDLKNLTDLLKRHSDSISLISFSHISNVIGLINPIEEICGLIRRYAKNSLILLDAAQAVSHLKIDFSKLDVDALVFSGHKMLGPMGIGGLLVRKSLLDSATLSPWLFGGGMIQSVSETQTKFAEDLVDRFTAGTPDVASLAGLAAACEYLDRLDMAKVAGHSKKLSSYTLEKLGRLPQIKIVGPVADSTIEGRMGLVSFTYQGVHPHDVAQILDSQGIAVRSGHHCAMPLHDALGINGSVRASFQVYNSLNDIDRLVEGLDKVKKVFRL